MGTGIRAEVKVDAAGTCPAARVARETGTETYSISRSVNPGDSATVTEEFMLDVDDPDAVDEPGDVTPVFTYGSKTVYNFDRNLGCGCPCECVEQFDCPVVDIHTRDGELYLVFHTPDMETLQQVVTALRDQYPGVDIQRLIREQSDGEDRDLVFVDRGRLTDRQRDVLETAHRMGYFDHPRGANAGEVADELGISQATFAEHLALAQSKLLDAILDS